MDAAGRQRNGLGDERQKEISDFEEIVAVLLEDDASVASMDKAGTTPLKLADEMKTSEKIRQLLRRKRAVMDARFRHATFDDR